MIDSMPEVSSRVPSRLPTSKTMAEAQVLLEGEFPDSEMVVVSAKTIRADATWVWDSLDELVHNLSANTSPAVASFHVSFWDGSDRVASVIFQGDNSLWATTHITVSATSEAKAEALRTQLAALAERGDIVEPTKESPAPVPKIFVGHGRSPLWRELKDHLQDSHGFSVRAFETGSRAGHTIRDILNSELDRSNFAFIVMTGEDEQGNGATRARQNVVHEAGLFQGKLGFERAIILLEEGVEGFSNVDGIQYIPFSQGNIREAFGDAAAAVKSAFGL